MIIAGMYMCLEIIQCSINRVYTARNSESWKST